MSPVLYALLPNEQCATYKLLFKFMKILVANTQPWTILCDFEMAAMNAIRECFPEVPLKGCSFHLTQHEEAFAKMVSALALVPVLDLEEYVAALEEYLPGMLQPLLNSGSRTIT
ncbi:hypothetical protein E2320_014244 [Naja naja]|nr:hypothetical protein E2320_014244 [Naja naja]